jgi:hypothetical protein
VDNIKPLMPTLVRVLKRWSSGATMVLPDPRRAQQGSSWSSAVGHAIEETQCMLRESLPTIPVFRRKGRTTEGRSVGSSPETDVYASKNVCVFACDTTSSKTPRRRSWVAETGIVSKSGPTLLVNSCLHYLVSNCSVLSSSSDLSFTNNIQLVDFGCTSH